MATDQEQLSCLSTFNSVDDKVHDMVSSHSLLDLVKVADSFSIEREREIFAAPSSKVGFPLRLGVTTIGLVPPQVIPLLKDYPSVFVFHSSWIALHNSLISDIDVCSQAVETVMRAWKSDKRFPCLTGWREEAYDVFGVRSSEDPKKEVIMKIERSAAGL